MSNNNITNSEGHIRISYKNKNLNKESRDIIKMEIRGRRIYIGIWLKRKLTIITMRTYRYIR